MILVIEHLTCFTYSRPVFLEPHILRLRPRCDWNQRLLDFEMEIARLGKELGKVEKDLAQIAKKLANQGYLENAPTEVIEKNRERRELLAETYQKLTDNLERIRHLQQ